MYMSRLVCKHRHILIHAGDCGVQVLELELKAGVSHLTWVLGSKFRSSERAVHVLNC